MTNFKTVEVLFENKSHNYKTSVNGQSSDESLKEYFVGTQFDMGIFPREDFQQCIGININ